MRLKKLRQEFVVAGMYKCRSTVVQSETADFAPVPPPGELDVTHASYPILSIRSIMWKQSVIRKTGSKNISHCRQRRTEARPQVTNIENSVKLGRVVFRDMRANRQIDKDTYRHADHNTSNPYQGRTKTSITQCVSKKQYTWLLTITSANVDRFSKFLNWQILNETLQ